MTVEVSIPYRKFNNEERGVDPSDVSEFPSLIGSSITSGRNIR